MHVCIFVMMWSTIAWYSAQLQVKERSNATYDHIACSAMSHIPKLDTQLIYCSHIYTLIGFSPVHSLSYWLLCYLHQWISLLGSNNSQISLVPRPSPSLSSVGPENEATARFSLAYLSKSTQSSGTRTKYACSLGQHVSEMLCSRIAPS